MKKIVTLTIITIFSASVFAQDSPEKIMEKRAREMHRAIASPDKEQWKKFISENYTQTLIDKPMRASVEEATDKGTTSSSSTEESKGKSNVESKAAFYERLHDDFGNSKIVSLKPDGDQLEMILENETGIKGTFLLKFNKLKHYLIDGLGIEVNN